MYTWECKWSPRGNRTDHSWEMAAPERAEDTWISFPLVGRVLPFMDPSEYIWGKWSNRALCSLSPGHSCVVVCFLLCAVERGVIYSSPQWLQASVSQAKLPHLRRLVLNQITVCSSGSRVGTCVSELNWGLLPLSASSVQSGDVLSRFYPVPSLLHLHIRLSTWSQPVSVIQCPATSSTSYPRVLAVVQGSLLLGSSSWGMEYDVRSIWELIR